MTQQRVNLSDETHEQVLSAAAFLRRALRFWRMALAVFVVGAVACAVFLFVRQPMFRSETVILYSEGVLLGNDADRANPARSVSARLKEILMSRASLDAVVREFDLYPEIRKTRGPVDAVEELRKHIEFRAPGGDTFTLAFTGSSPTEARAVTARLAEVVIGQDSDLRSRQATLVRDFLETEKRATDDGLREAELALASFMAAHPRFALDATPLATGAAIRASVGAGDVHPLPPLATAAPRFFSRPLHMTEAGTASASNGSAEQAPSGAREAAAEEARAKAALAASQVNLADLAARFTAAHPDVRAAQAEVQRATSRLATARAAVASIERLSSTTGHSVQPAPSLPALTPNPSPVAAMSNQRPTVSQPASAVVSPAPIGGSQGGSEHDVVALETEWVKLTRAATEARQHQDQVEAALFKAKSAANSESGDHRVQVTIIDPAFSPQSAVPPGRAMIGVLFAGVALLLAIAGALFKAFLDDRVFEGRDIGQFALVLVEVPRRAHVSRR
jgi:capsular polysaccharide biosynthesis protein